MSIMDWMRVNNLKLNQDKTEVLMINQKADQGTRLHPVLDGVSLSLKIEVCSLRVLLGSSLSMDAQVLMVDHKCICTINIY